MYLPVFGSRGSGGEQSSPPQVSQTTRTHPARPTGRLRPAATACTRAIRSRWRYSMLALLLSHALLAAIAQGATPRAWSVHKGKRGPEHRNGQLRRPLVARQREDAGGLRGARPGAQRDDLRVEREVPPLLPAARRHVVAREERPRTVSGCGRGSRHRLRRAIAVASRQRQRRRRQRRQCRRLQRRPRARPSAATSRTTWSTSPAAVATDPADPWAPHQCSCPTKQLAWPSQEAAASGLTCCGGAVEKRPVSLPKALVVYMRLKCLNAWVWAQACLTRARPVRICNISSSIFH